MCSNGRNARRPHTQNKLHSPLGSCLRRRGFDRSVGMSMLLWFSDGPSSSGLVLGWNAGAVASNGCITPVRGVVDLCATVRASPVLVRPRPGRLPFPPFPPLCCEAAVSGTTTCMVTLRVSLSPTRSRGRRRSSCSSTGLDPRRRSRQGGRRRRRLERRLVRRRSSARRVVVGRS